MSGRREYGDCRLVPNVSPLIGRLEPPYHLSRVSPGRCPAIIQNRRPTFLVIAGVGSSLSTTAIHHSTRYGCLSFQAHRCSPTTPGGSGGKDAWFDELALHLCDRRGAVVVLRRVVHHTHRELGVQGCLRPSYQARSDRIGHYQHTFFVIGPYRPDRRPARLQPRH